jgi:hypothetical protein
LGVQINSDSGHVVLVVGPMEPTVKSFITGHLPSHGSTDAFYDGDILGFYFKRTPNGRRLDIPYWFIVLLNAAIAAAPWLPWWSKRFSLRTLLIATTLIAVALWLIVWVVKRI